jgi:hypothetical protein
MSIKDHWTQLQQYKWEYLRIIDFNSNYEHFEYYYSYYLNP